MHPSFEEGFTFDLDEKIRLRQRSDHERCSRGVTTVLKVGRIDAVHLSEVLPSGEVHRDLADAIPSGAGRLQESVYVFHSLLHLAGKVGRKLPALSKTGRSRN